MRAVESSLKKLDTNYIDIMLVHQPLGDYYGSWRAMEELYDQNVLRGLGLSNFYEDRLIDLLYHCNVKPVVNQIECHPFNQRQSLLQLMRKHQVVGMAWSPFTRDRQPILTTRSLKAWLKNTVSQNTKSSYVGISNEASFHCQRQIT